MTVRQFVETLALFVLIMLMVLGLWLFLNWPARGQNIMPLALPVEDGTNSIAIPQTNIIIRLIRPATNAIVRLRYTPSFKPAMWMDVTQPDVNWLGTNGSVVLSNDFKQGYFTANVSGEQRPLSTYTNAFTVTQSGNATIVNPVGQPFTDPRFWTNLAMQQAYLATNVTGLTNPSLSIGSKGVYVYGTGKNVPRRIEAQ